MSFQRALSKLPPEEITGALTKMCLNPRCPELGEPQPISSAFKTSNTHCKCYLLHVASPDDPHPFQPGGIAPSTWTLCPCEVPGGKW